MAGSWPHRWEQLVRYRYIELIALWEGRLTTRHLCDHFGIGRQQASKDINTYKRTVAPGNLVYDKFLKGYTPSPVFAPQVTEGHAEEYLQMLASEGELNRTLGDLALPSRHVEVLRPPERRLAPELMRPLITAARQCLRIEVDYVSLNHPDREGRIIVPHTLVWTGQRWHVRAWCEKNLDYRDFVLSRFRGAADVLGPSEQGADADSEWQTRVAVIIVPDERLSAEQQDVVANDYLMDAGSLTIEVRGRLVPYLLQLLNIDPNQALADPRAQQVRLANRDALAPWLLG